MGTIRDYDERCIYATRSYCLSPIYFCVYKSNINRKKINFHSFQKGKQIIPEKSKSILCIHRCVVFIHCHFQLESLYYLILYSSYFSFLYCFFIFQIRLETETKYEKSILARNSDSHTGMVHPP